MKHVWFVILAPAKAGGPVETDIHSSTDPPDRVGREMGRIALQIPESAQPAWNTLSELENDSWRGELGLPLETLFSSPWNDCKPPCSWVVIYADRSELVTSKPREPKGALGIVPCRICSELNTFMRTAPLLHTKELVEFLVGQAFHYYQSQDWPIGEVAEESDEDY